MFQINRIRIFYINGAGATDFEIFEIEIGLLIGVDINIIDGTAHIKYTMQGADPVTETVSDCAAIRAVEAYYSESIG